MLLKIKGVNKGVNPFIFTILSNIPEKLNGYSNPEIPVQRAVLDGFHQMQRQDGLFPGEIGDGAGHFQDAIIGAGSTFRLRLFGYFLRFQIQRPGSSF